MELFIVILFITIIFAVVIGISVITREEVPDVLIEEINDELDQRREELKEEEIVKNRK